MSRRRPRGRAGVAPQGNATPAATEPVLTVEITLDALQIGDLALLERFDAKDHTQTELVEFLDRVVVGGASHLPITQLGRVIHALSQELRAGSNPKN